METLVETEKTANKPEIETNQFNNDQHTENGTILSETDGKQTKIVEETKVEMPEIKEKTEIEEKTEVPVENTQGNGIENTETVTVIEESEVIPENPEEINKIVEEDPLKTCEEPEKICESKQEEEEDEKEKIEGKIEITELNSNEDRNEEMDTTMEYAIIEEPNEPPENEQIVLINENKNQRQYVEEVFIINEEQEDIMEDELEEELVKSYECEEKPKKQRGRKPISDIPLHVLGRDISKPSEGVSNGGRIMPKPRLGVKVPYRNLTSQIVSKEEIQKEIMDRFKQKQEQHTPNPGDVLFARKLTQRLAKKLTNTENKDKKIEVQAESESDTKINDNSDLIAILEGNDEKDKQREKEIALQQLKELPISKNRIFKSRGLQQQQQQQQDEKKETRQSTKSDVKPTDVVPQLKADMCIKTYARKRKSFDSDFILPIKRQEEQPKTNQANIYMTKSSRIIKKKVIWDPDDEASPKKNESPTKKVETVTKQEKKESPQRQEKKELPQKQEKKDLPVKVEKKELLQKQERKEPVQRQEKKELVQKQDKKESPQKQTKSSPESSPEKGGKKNKRLTEVDRLLMDEGAINMLYDINEDKNEQKSKKKTQKDLISKTNLIKNDLKQNTIKQSPKSLRKKDISKKESPLRKISKDSIRSNSPDSFVNADESRIISRHSSSSFSSADEMGINEDDGNVDGEEEKTQSVKRKLNSIDKDKKKVKKSKIERIKNNNNNLDSTKYESFNLKKTQKLVSIEFNEKFDYFLTEQTLKELISCLNELAKEDNCNIVSVTSNNNNIFCRGLDYKSIVARNEEERKKKATDLAVLLNEFLKCLLNFPKVLVAGIQGDCIGLSVTMLPLFDMIIASDISTFNTPFANLGCCAEAGFLLTVPFMTNNGLASDLLFTSQTIKADDAFRRGLITKLCWPEKYIEEFKGILQKVATQSRQSLETTKKQLRDNIRETIEASLDSQTNVLIQHWISTECQKKFSTHKIEIE